MDELYARRLAGGRPDGASSGALHGRHDPDFAAKAADIIGLYLNPPEHAAAFCVDEKTAIQALVRLDAVPPLSPRPRSVTPARISSLSSSVFTSVNDPARKIRRYIKACSTNAQPSQ